MYAVFLCDHNTSCEDYFFFLRQMDMRSLTCAQILGACCTHKGGGGQAQISLHKGWLGGIEKVPLNLPHQGIEPSVLGFDFWHTNHWAMFPQENIANTSVGSIFCTASEISFHRTVIAEPNKLVETWTIPKPDSNKIDTSCITSQLKPNIFDVYAIQICTTFDRKLLITGIQNSLHYCPN